MGQAMHILIVIFFGTSDVQNIYVEIQLHGPHLTGLVSSESQNRGGKQNLIPPKHMCI